MRDGWRAYGSASQAMAALGQACIALAKAQVIGRLATPPATEGGKRMKARIEGGEPDVLFDGSMACMPVPLVLLADLRLSGEILPATKAGMPCLATIDGTNGTVLNFASGFRLVWDQSCKGKLRRLRPKERIAIGPVPGEMALEGAEAQHDSYSCELMAAGAWAVVAYSANPMFVAGEPIMRLVPGGGWTSSQSKAYMSASGVAVPNLAGVSVRNLRKGERVVID